MLPLLAAISLTAFAAHGAFDQPAALGNLPPSPVEQPATEEVIKVCTTNFIEEVDQTKTGKHPDMIDVYAEDKHLNQKQAQQVREYCKAYSSGAAFVVASVIIDATIKDILTRSRIPVIPVHTAKGRNK
jgi:hypothetical protein